MIPRIKQYFHENSIRRLRAGQSVDLPDGFFDNIRTIGLAFCADDGDDVNSTLRFRDKLVSRKINVDTLGYFNMKEEPPPADFGFFNKKGVNFKQVPTSDVATHFIQRQFDILINLDHQAHPPLVYAAAASHSLFKIGPANGDTDIYDLMIDLGEHYDANKMIIEIRRTLKVLK